MAIGLDESTPDHSTISRSRRLIDLETHREVFGWVLGLLADRGLIKGKRIGIDATTLEANAAMRSIVRRDNGASYEEFLKDAHNKAAEHHDNATKAHRTAAEHHGKGDHAAGKKHSMTALEHSGKAHEASKTAHEKSGQQK